MQAKVRAQHTCGRGSRAACTAHTGRVAEPSMAPDAAMSKLSRRQAALAPAVALAGGLLLQSQPAMAANAVAEFWQG